MSSLTTSTSCSETSTDGLLLTKNNARINQLNGREVDNTQKQLSMRINACMLNDDSGSVSIMKCLMRETALDFEVFYNNTSVTLQF